VLLLSATAPPSAAAELPLGPRSLDERRSVARVAPGVRWTRIVREGGPWRVNVLTVAPAARVAVAPAGDAVGERARPSAVSRRLRAVAAVNGGYFAGDGNPVGALATAGRLLSEPVGGRSALLLGAPRRIAALRSEGSVRVGDGVRLLDGINRTPGEIPACGGRGGDRPTERPDAATTCTDPSELVAFTPEWGPRTPRRNGSLDAVVRDGAVTALRAGGGAPVPPDGTVLTATGSARPLLDRAGVGAAVELDPEIRTRPRAPAAEATGEGAREAAGGHAQAAAGGHAQDAAGGHAQDAAGGHARGHAQEPLGDIAGGGPRLLAGGRVRVRSSAEGFAPLSAPWFHGSFVAARHPRTLAGVRSDGTLLLVTVDGRRPGWSAGVTLNEAARVMRSLGARDALNLDGGGSTAMAVRGRTVSRPSDPTGERPVSDALMVLP
jgi:Phosphodiester glycosidase